MTTRRHCLQHRHTFGLSPLGILTVTTTVLILARGQQSFSENESYGVYPGWNGLTVSESLLQITFRTSASNGLILYAEGEAGDMKEALEIRLEGGCIVVEVLRQVVDRVVGIFVLYESQSEKLHLSKNLNDNQAHTLSLQRSGGQVTINILDKSESVSSTLLATQWRFDATPIGSRAIYIGGLPTSISSLFNTRTFAFMGCLDNIGFANNSSTSESLVNIVPVQSNGVVDGCMDPCSNTSCGDVSCVPILPDRFFCDCSSTDMGGANCNEDVSMHRLNLNLDRHLCYSLNIYPLIDRVGSIQLVPPLPESGTIMTGVTFTGDSFSLYLLDRVLNLDFVPYNKTRVRLTVREALNLNAKYRIDFQLGIDQVELGLATVSGRILTEIVRMRENLTTPAVNGVFTTICVGGTMLEMPYYEGIVERVIFNRAPLSDQSFMGQVSKESLTNVISFRRNIQEPPLRFEKLNFENYLRISFEMRQEDETISTILESKNDVNEIALMVFNDKLNFFATNVFGTDCDLVPVKINDNSWHHVDFQLLLFNDSTANFRLIIDKQPNNLCQLRNELAQRSLRGVLDSLINSSSPLEFGVAEQVRVHIGEQSGIANFVGCFRNFEFRQTADAPPVRPDLASAIRTEKRFGPGDTCYGCTPQEANRVSCQNGEECASCGFGETGCHLSLGGVCQRGSSTTPPPSNFTTEVSPTELLTTTQLPTPTPTPPPTVTEQPTNTIPTSVTVLSQEQIIMIAAIAVGALIAVILIFVLVIIGVCVCLKLSAGKQGFYKTEESNGKVVTMLHYSASLRQIASEQVTMAETNGISPMHADGLRAKEFYL